MGEPNNPCFKPSSPYQIWTVTTTTSTTTQAPDQDYFVIPTSGATCPSFTIDDQTDIIEYPPISTEAKNTFICYSEAYDPNPCILEADKYIRVADINVELNQCKRFKLILTDIPTTTTTTTTTTAEPSIGENSANYYYCADWNEVNGNVTTVGSNGGPSYYLTYDQAGNAYEWCTASNYYTIARARGGSFSSNPAYIISSADYLDWYADYTLHNASSFRIAAATNMNDPYLVYIGDIDNPSDSNGIGSVSYGYKIGKFKVTNCEYAEFLNAIASTDTYGLYDPYMSYDRGGIIQEGTNGSHIYTVRTNMGNKPVLQLTWLDAARYCNWLHNGKPNGPQNGGTTEDGAYTLNGIMSSYYAINKNVSAKYWIPLDDEWYKAAYYNGNNQTYWQYATQSNDEPTCISANSMGDGPRQTSYTLCPSTPVSTTTTTTTTVSPCYTMRYSNGVSNVQNYGSYAIGTVTASIGGAIWGTNQYGYTDDSRFNTAVIHAGLLSAGQTAQIKFTFLGLKNNFPSSISNGIVSSTWSSSWCAVSLSLP